MAGIGRGPTTLAALDGALLVAGIAHFNLIALTSVIPPGATIISHTGAATSNGGWGDRLYVVIAEQREERMGHEAWAAVGWVQDETTGRGLFVEHCGESRKQVEVSVEASLEAMASARGLDPTLAQIRVEGTQCDGTPCCALVVAVFAAAGWLGERP